MAIAAYLTQIAADQMFVAVVIPVDVAHDQIALNVAPVKGAGGLGELGPTGAHVTVRDAAMLMNQRKRDGEELAT